MKGYRFMYTDNGALFFGFHPPGDPWAKWYRIGDN